VKGEGNVAPGLESVMMTRRSVLGSGVLGVLMAACGCGSGELPNNDRVEGTVLLDGKKLAGVTVEFTPLALTPGRHPIRSKATTDENGRYRLTRTDKKPGAVICQHRVTIGPARPGPTTVPPVYWISGSTPLYIDVVAGQHDYELKLSKDAKPSGAREPGD
jgi:hypothetical protein